MKYTVYDNIRTWPWMSKEIGSLRMRLENQAYLLKQMEEKDSRKNEETSCDSMTGGIGRWSSGPWSWNTEALQISPLDLPSSKPIDFGNPWKPRDPKKVMATVVYHFFIVSWGNWFHRFISQEKYLQHIQAAILERDSEEYNAVEKQKVIDRKVRNLEHRKAGHPVTMPLLNHKKISTNYKVSSYRFISSFIHCIYVYVHLQAHKNPHFKSAQRWKRPQVSSDKDDLCGSFGSRGNSDEECK